MCIVYGLNLLANLENKVGTAIDGLAVSLTVDGLVRLQLGYGLTQFLEVALARVVCKFDYEFLTSFPLCHSSSLSLPHLDALHWRDSRDQRRRRRRTASAAAASELRIRNPHQHAVELSLYPMYCYSVLYMYMYMLIYNSGENRFELYVNLTTLSASVKRATDLITINCCCFYIKLIINIVAVSVAVCCICICKCIHKFVYLYL